MLIRDYADFVERRDLTAAEPSSRFYVAVYGLVGEVGSLSAALKKRLLAAGRRDWDVPNEEIVEELGDCLWYAFAIAAATGRPDAFLSVDVAALAGEVGAEDGRGERLRAVLGSDAALFLERAPGLAASIEAGTATLDDYRRTAFLTARTRDAELVGVCLAVLQQLTAELLRGGLPPIERELNTRLPDRPVDVVLGEVAWHLAALATVYRLELGDVAALNVAKLQRRFDRSNPTPLPDAGMPEGERLPRRFEVAFVAVGPGRSRMYLDGRRLGDDLTDNAYEDDGYRFHDVLHLALAAKLGWSPVLRKLMGRKRRSAPRTDEVEDGARAMIVEETVIKAIHAEGLRIAASDPPAPDAPLVSGGRQLSFGFLKRLEALAAGLESSRSGYWEWEEAVVAGFALFAELRRWGRGTVTVDLEARSLSFVPEVFLDLVGTVAGLGVVRSGAEGAPMTPGSPAPSGADGAGAIEGAEAVLLAEGVARSLGLGSDAAGGISVRGRRAGILDVRLEREAAEAAWRLGVVTFRADRTGADDPSVSVVLALADRT